MSDEQQDLNLEDVGAGAEDVAGPRKGGLLSGMLLTILKWAAIGIGGVIIIVTVTVITFKIVSKGNQQQGLAAMSPEYSAKAEPLASYDDIEQIRGQTADDPPAIFLMQVSLGYDPKDKEVSVEIGNRKREIQDLILKDISQKKAADLAPAQYDNVQQDLMNQINMIMKNGKVKSVMFRQFVVQK
ncbi:MAG: flagellar basal body-associated FliL family protein [Spirochaetia bacterium]|jgi:flagellar FliL protein